jgi:GTP-binding protein HflX
LVEDRLFATLDPTSRRLDLPGGQPVMLIDTVGFINKLPHQLVDAFKSTLEEVRTADLLLHVVDATHPRWAEQQAVVGRVLEEIGAGEKPVLTVFNKLDRFTDELAVAGQPWSRGSAAQDGAESEGQACGISALTGRGLQPLLAAIERRLGHGRELVHVELPLAAGKILAWLRRSGKVVEEAYTDTAVSVTVLMSRKAAGQLRKLLTVGNDHGQ